MSALKEIWTWIFLQKNDKEMEELVKKAGIKISGFRPGTIPKNSKKLVASTVTNNVNIKKLDALKYEPQSKITERYNFKEMSVTDFLDIDDIPFGIILSYLITNDKKPEAEELFEIMRKRNTDDELEVLEQKRINNYINNFMNELEKRSNEKINNEEKKDEKKMLKMELKLNKTSKLYNKLQEELSTYKLKTKEQIKLLSIENHKLNQQLIVLQKEKEKKDEELILHEKEKINIFKESSKKVEELKNENNFLKGNVEELEEQLKNVKLSNRHNGNNLKEVPEDSSKKILLIGNPFNEKIFQDIEIEVDFIEKFEIESTNLNIYEEIIFLSYRVDETFYLKLSKSNHKIKKVENFLDLKKELLKYKRVV